MSGPDGPPRVMPMDESDRDRRLKVLRRRARDELEAPEQATTAVEVEVSAEPIGVPSGGDAPASGRRGRRARRGKGEASRSLLGRIEQREHELERSAVEVVHEHLPDPPEQVTTAVEVEVSAEPIDVPSGGDAPASGRRGRRARRGKGEASRSLLGRIEQREHELERSAVEVVYGHLPEIFRDAAETIVGRRAAAWFILGGSLLGLLSGVLLWAGTPDIVGSVLAEGEPADISGIVLNNTTGESVEFVLIQVLDGKGGPELRRTETGRQGRFLVADVPAREVEVVASLADSGTIRVLIVPTAGEQLILSLPWEDDELEEDRRTTSQLPVAVSAARAVALLTIGFAVVGLMAASSAWSGRRYRRTMWLAGLGMLSRGMVWLGPLLILIGMGFLLIARGLFEDELEAALAAAED